MPQHVRELLKAVQAATTPALALKYLRDIDARQVTLETLEYLLDEFFGDDSDVLEFTVEYMRLRCWDKAHEKLSQKLALMANRLSEDIALGRLSLEDLETEAAKMLLLRRIIDIVAIHS